MLLGLAAAPLAAQVNAPAEPPGLVAVHLWAAGRTVPLRIAARSNGQDSYVPLTALDVVGAQFRLVSNAAAVHITAKNGREGDIVLTPVKSIPMVSLGE